MTDHSLNKNSGDITIWPTKMVKVDALVPYERNPRKITPKALERLKGKIQRLGFNSPIVATHDLRIIGGHQRIQALKELGVTDVQVAYAPYEMTIEQMKEAIIENNISDGEWDFDMLATDFDEFELEQFGMDKPTMAKLRGKIKAGLTDPDETPAIASVAISAPGDTWMLLGADGNAGHRLRCGDSTNAEDVAALLAGAAPHLMVTDPPYGVEYDANWRNEAARTSEGMGNRAIGAGAIGKVLNDDCADWRAAWALFPGDVIYVWHAGIFSPLVGNTLTYCNFELRNLIIWAKSQLVIGRGHYHHQHEPCWYAVRKGGTGHWQGDRKQTTLWQIDKPQKSETGHSTQKPVECMRKPMENNSAPGDAVYEPFSGSGTTIIAGEQCGRVVYAMELSPLYVDMAVKRWQAFTGRQAINEATGKVFPE